MAAAAGWVRQASFGLGAGIVGLCTAALPARGLTITPIFDASVTHLSNAAAVEQAFRIAASAYVGVISSPVTVNVSVSWGKVDGYALPSGALGGSIDPLYGYFTYGQVRGWLPATDILPPAPAAGSRYVIPSAEAKAIGLLPAGALGVDGYIGFGLTPSNYTLTPGKTKAGTYSFIGVVEHELAEVLGRISGLGNGYASLFDLFRYARTGAGKAKLSTATNGVAYFSADGGTTQDGPVFNNVGSGDRSDWSTTPASTDVQDAFLYRGMTPSLSQADLDALRVLGWRAGFDGPSQSLAALQGGVRFALVSEPGSIGLLAVALAALLAATPRRRLREAGRLRRGPGSAAW